MNSIGILGAGAIGSAFARALAKQGLPAVIANSRGPESLAELVRELGPSIKAGTREEAAAQDIVLVAVNWSKLPAALAGLPQVVVSEAAHALEHSLEVQLPFLQATLGDFSLLPLAVGEASPQAVAEVLDRLWGGPETLIVISSDLSHFLPYAAANQVDRDTCQHILQLDTDIRPEQACGAYPINGLLLAARRRGLAPQLIHRCNSGDTAGDKQRVVGYAAFSFTEAQDA